MYKIKLPDFEGPFDLLLYFIKRDELNIYDIPISKITKEFLNYIRIMQMFDLELAGEFLVMSSTLMYVKTQMLLPKKQDEDGEIEDPRTELVQRIIEYKQFKEAAGDLREFSEDTKYDHYRKLFEEDYKMAMQDDWENYTNTTLFDLIRAFKKVLDKTPDDPSPHVVNLVPVSVDEKKNEILDYLNKKKRASFFDLVKDVHKQYVIVTFLALLDLIKSDKIMIKQSQLFDDIIISRKPELNLN